MMARVRKLLSEFEAIPAALRDLATATRALIEHVSKQSDRSIDIKIQKSSRNAAWTAAFVAFLSIVLTGFAGWIANRQLNATLAENTRLRSQMYLDERPWLKAVVGDDYRLDVVAGQSVTVHMRVKDIGKTIAKSPLTVVKVQKLGPSEMPNVDPKAPEWTTVSTGLLFPDDDVPVDAPWRRNDGEVVLASPNDVSDWNAGRIFFLMFGRIQYTDVFGTPHWTHFCKFFHHPPSVDMQIRACLENFNAVDDNTVDGQHTEPYVDAWR